MIRHTADAIRAECQRNGAGNWDRWQCETTPYRAALKSKLDGLRRFAIPRSSAREARCEPLEGADGFPLFEVGARDNLNHLVDEHSLEQFSADRPVIAARRWLRQRGIDLIFVPVPKMTEVYIEHFLDPCPADGIIAPQVRSTLLDLLDNDVEVVDGFPLFRSLRDTDSEYLYNTGDPHWAPRAMRVMAKEVADRIARYTFGARARYAIPIVKAEPGTYLLDYCPGGIGSEGGWSALSDDQQRRAIAAQTTTLPYVTMVGGGAPIDDPRSPVLLIGHSFTANFRELLIKELNLLIRMHAGAGHTTEAFGDFLRAPELLDGCRVVVWITTEQHMTHFSPLPPPIAATAK